VLENVVSHHYLMCSISTFSDYEKPSLELLIANY
jgi:hypothetical protein